MAVKRGLGRGLNDLLSVSEDEAKQAKKDEKIRRILSMVDLPTRPLC